jgi:type 1 glutamine amidotransferase
MIHNTTPSRSVTNLLWALCLVTWTTSSVLSQGASGQTASFRMPHYADMDPPPARTTADIERLLAGKDTSQPAEGTDAKPLRIVLVAGAKDHGKGEHDYPAWLNVWSKLLAEAPRTEIDTAMDFPSADQIDKADVLVFYQRGLWDADRAAAIDPFLARGGGLVYIHWAVDGRGQEAEMARRIGLAAHGGQIAYRHGPLHIDFAPGKKHPVARNFDAIDWVDESYWKLTGDPQNIHLIGTSREDDAPQPQFWSVEQDRGRVFVSILGHYMWTFDDPAFRLLLMRGIAWAGHRNVDRFDSLITLDARIAE